MFCIGGAGAALLVTILSTIQHFVPDSRRGRVFGVSDMATMGAMVAASGLLGSWAIVDDLYEREVASRAPERDWAEPAENPLGAWYVTTDLRTTETGPLAGSRVAIKDNVSVAGVPMMNGSETVRGFVPRADATVVTRLLEAGATIAGKAVAAGEYTLFIDLAPNDKWTLIVSKWPAQTTYDESNRAALWGAYEYTPERDIVRAPMRIERLPHAYEQLSWEFLDITPKGGLIALVWDRKLASVAFTVAN